MRQLLPSDELFPVVDLKVRLRNEIKPFGFIEGDEGFNFFLHQISLKSRIDISENTTTNRLSDVYFIKLNTFRNEENTIQGRLAWEKELDILPEYGRGELAVRYNQIRSLNRRSSEVLTIYNEAIAIDGEFKLTNRVESTLLLSKSTYSSESNTLSSRNFDIHSYNIEPGLNATINRSWRTGFSFSYADKSDRSSLSPIDAKIYKIRNSNRLFLFKKIQANSFLEIRSARVNGESSSYGIFELTDGTGKGTNMLWSLGGNYRMSDLIRLNFTYDGRTVRDRPAIHTFKIVVNAIF